MRRWTLLAVAITLGGCSIDLFGDDDPCQYDTRGAADYEAIAALQLVNPATLQCEYFDTYPCDPACGECPPPPQPPTWGECYDGCSALDEATCMVTTACRATYDYQCYATDALCPLPTPFLGCFPVDHTGPITGDCPGLDAFGCSQHDNCIALHSTDYACPPQTSCPHNFVECWPEPGPNPV